MKYTLSRFGLAVLFALGGCASGVAPSASKPASPAVPAGIASSATPIDAVPGAQNAPATRPGQPEAVASASAGASGVSAHSPQTDVEPAHHEIAVAELAEAREYESQAFDAVHRGKFDLGSDLLKQAFKITNDTQIHEMLGWISGYEAEMSGFAKERHKQFEQAVADAHILLDHHLSGFATDEARQAYMLADDKDTFRKEHWIQSMITEASLLADKCEAEHEYIKALTLYDDLIVLDPGNTTWNEKQKMAARRARLLMDYAPERFKKLRASNYRERQAAEALLPVTTRPGAKPTTQPDDSVATDSFSADWREMTRGIDFDMLWQALVLADKQYYRNVNYQTLLDGGVMALRAIVTTPGMEDAFPAIADPQKKAAFLDAINAAEADARAANADNAQDVLGDALRNLMYVDHRTVDLPDPVFISEFADGAFTKLDPFTSMIWPYDMEELQKTTQGEFGGVGIQIKDDEWGNLKVVTPLAGTPARRAGIKAGGIITRINGKSTKGVSIEHAVKTITGTPGSEVTLTVRDIDGTAKDYRLRREMIKVDSVKGYMPTPGGGWNWFVDPQNGIADIRLTNFSKSTSEDLSRALDEIRGSGARAIVLDLRSNPGGLLQSATEVVNKFIDDGVIVSTHADRITSYPPSIADAKHEDDETDLPMVVLINQYSASASEIVSGALQDHKRAILVGERTFGKGSVQMLFPLDNAKESCLRLTTSHYYLPSGRCIHREENSPTWGVDPDVPVEITPDQMVAATNAREDMDVLPDADSKPTTRPEELIGRDPQLAAAVLVLRLELAGAKL